MSTELQTLRWQFDLTMQLAQVHLPHLTDEMCLWEPSPHSWSVRQGADGRWQADWGESEPDPIPTPTMGWLTWHIGWWWSGLIAAMQQQTPAPPQNILWAGSAEGAIRHITSLGAQWTGMLAALTVDELERPFAYPWQTPYPLRLALAWANSELMKNVSEIGYLRLLWEASRQP